MVFADLLGMRTNKHHVFSNTTATCIRTILSHLRTFPIAYQTLRAEVSSANLSSPVSESEAKAVFYLQAVIEEGLRMWPPVSAMMFKVAPDGGDFIASVRMREGTKVGVCWYGVSRSKECYGEHANVFQPERWLEANAAKL